MAENQESSKSTRPLTVLFLPFGGAGPINQVIGMGDVLRRRGHRVIIVVDSTWKGKIAALGLQEYIIDLIEPSQKETEKNPGESWITRVRELILTLRHPPIVQLATCILPTFQAAIAEMKLYEPHLRHIIDHIRPDVIVQDQLLCCPALVTSLVPWVRITSCNPLELRGANIPPKFSGLSQDDRSQWDAFLTEYGRLLHPIWKEFNDWVQVHGAPSLPKLELIHESEHANIYIYPEEADYLVNRPLGPKFYRIDSSVRETDQDYELPQAIHDRPNDCSLVYLSLGSLACVDTVLMQRIIDALCRTRHRFIVSIGPMGHELKLPDSMVGEPKLPQTNVIPLVDLVITHGGNNTVTETLHFGKPMLILPIFLDQHDNAQRMHEMGFGIRIDTYNFADEDLLTAVDRLLKDIALRDRMTRLGEKIRQRNGLRSGVDIIERLGRAYADCIALRRRTTKTLD